jgi:PAS domain S-box-containing protein
VQAEGLLSRSEARLRGILDSAMDAIITIDQHQKIVLFNAAAESMFQFTQAEAIGMPVDAFIPERFRGSHGKHVRGFGESGDVARRMGAARIVTGVRRDGSEFPIDAAISQLADGDARYYTVILRDVSERVQAHEDLRRSKEELQELSSTAHIAREQEKNRIARELHDELGQALTMLQMDVAWAKAHVTPEQEEFVTRLDRMQKLLKTTVAATRRIAADLRPLMLDDLGIVPALEWLAENFTQRTGVPCRLTIEDPEMVLASLQATAVFRVVQESLTNIAKHAQATQAEVTVAADGPWLVVRIRDNGHGFSAQAPRKAGSFGLVGVRERAAMLRGDADIRSVPGEGTTIQVRLPVQPLGEAS